MGGPNRETVVVTLSDGSALHLRFDINAVCDFEEVMTAGGFDATRELHRMETSVRPTVSAVRAMVYASAREKRPDLTLRHVGDLLRTDGEALVKAAREAMQRAAPDPAPEGEAAEKQTPPNP
ncbi:hypothetical protein [Roseicitreum antarcticum]|uniref:Phage tail tube protein, GTA-gp10 n=1 Tax=Roseicitreum antarcticum TaxID=564137 RepID=A0A1H3ERC2_9RHOB|nr:hypothetical protein [Roseicitreum antarcticum]SDX81296.1 hypothetical protein SAMN04488238_12510 [Roseicitreum antarcticum]